MPPTNAPPTTRIRIATASPATQGTRRETLAQLERIVQAAAKEQADFLLFPEAYLGGYPRGSDFGCKIGGRSKEGRNEFQRYFRDAVDLGDIVGPGSAGGLGKWVGKTLGGGDHDAGAKGRVPRGDGTREELERIARDTGVFIVVGLVERAGGSLYCAVVYVCPRRGMIGKRRKVMPTGSERLIWVQGSPATLKAVSTTIRGVRINLAAAICWENYMPLLRQSLYAQNINLYFAPTADGRDTWLPLMRTIGIEGRCFVVSSNMCVRGGRDNSSITAGRGGARRSATGVDNEPYYSSSKPRRNSFMTEDGFEIALPSSPASLKREAAAAARTSKTITSPKTNGHHENGNEIASPSSAVVEEEEGEDGEEGEEAAVGNGNVNGKKTKFVSRGGSSIVSPFGAVLAGPQWEDDEGIIYADVDMDDCVRGRLDLDAAGSYSRNDSFKFSVDGLDLDPFPYYA